MARRRRRRAVKVEVTTKLDIWSTVRPKALAVIALRFDLSASVGGFCATSTNAAAIGGGFGGGFGVGAGGFDDGGGTGDDTGGFCDDGGGFGFGGGGGFVHAEALLVQHIDANEFIRVDSGLVVKVPSVLVSLIVMLQVDVVHAEIGITEADI